MYTQDHYCVEFDIKGATIGANIRRCKHNVKKIRNEICTILGLHENLVEIIRPKQIPNGIKMHINIYINNAKAIDLNCENMITDANNSGQLPKAIKAAWSLSEMPVISNIKYVKYASNERKKNAVNIRVNSADSIAMTEIQSANSGSLPPKVLPAIMTDFGSDIDTEGRNDKHDMTTNYLDIEDDDDDMLDEGHKTRGHDEDMRSTLDINTDGNEQVQHDVDQNDLNVGSLPPIIPPAVITDLGNKTENDFNEDSSEGDVICNDNQLTKGE